MIALVQQVWRSHKEACLPAPPTHTHSGKLCKEINRKLAGLPRVRVFPNATHRQLKSFKCEPSVNPSNAWPQLFLMIWSALSKQLSGQHRASLVKAWHYFSASPPPPPCTIILSFSISLLRNRKCSCNSMWMEEAMCIFTEGSLRGEKLLCLVQ